MKAKRVDESQKELSNHKDGGASENYRARYSRMETVKREADHLTKKVSETEQALEKRLTILWSELQEWRKDNHFITSGYRPDSNSIAGSFASLGYLHNETVNIYSHLLGALLAVIASLVFYSVLSPRYQTASSDDLAAFGCFFGGCIVCLSCSSIYHTLSNHSAKVARLGNSLDYLGIVFLIWGSFVPSIFYGFGEAQADLARTYWTMITTIGALCAAVTVLPQFRTPGWRPFRAAMFVAMGLSAVVPVLHGLQLFGLEKLDRQIGLAWLLLQGFLYILGAAIYAARVPERFKPGLFDLFGSSHQIFHVFVVLAAAAHFVGLLRAFDHAHRGIDFAS